ncbi:MAG: hypothetical protein GY909_15690 [Oligoflexia bacterium]|nr:hypothetical protein [Oligoflexia bacterium]
MHYQTIIKECESLDQKARKIYKCNSKRVKRFILLAESCQAYQILEFHFLLIKNGFPIDFLFFPDEKDLLGGFYRSHLPRYLNNSFIKSLKRYYSNKVIKRMFEDDGYNFESLYIRDIAGQIKKINKYPDLRKRLLKKKIRCFRWLDKHLSRLALYIEHTDYNLNQKKSVLEVHDKVFKIMDDTYKVLVPKTKHDLIKCSELFDFCIGTEDFYSKGITLGDFSFVAVFKNGIPWEGVLFDNVRIIQAYGKGNTSSSTHVRSFLRDLLFKSKKIEANSSWISHFLYHDGVLSVITKKEDTYQYKIDDETLWELENSQSRGSYYCRNIKGKFKNIA